MKHNTNTMAETTSDKTLAQKLLLKPNQRIYLAQAPEGYAELIAPLPEGATFVTDPRALVDVIQLFVKDREELEDYLPRLKIRLSRYGVIWVTYYKGTSKIDTDINRDTIVAWAQGIDLRPVRMISIDDDWSALMLKLI